MHQDLRSKEARRIHWQTPSLYWKRKRFCLHFKVQNCVTFCPMTAREWRRTYCVRVPFVGVFRLYGLCPEEWGDANHTHRIGWPFSLSELILWGGENSRAVLTEGTVSIHSCKESEITNVLLTNPKNDGGDAGAQWTEERALLALLIPGHKWAGDREGGSRHLLLMGVIGPVLTECCWAQLKVDI